MGIIKILVCDDCGVKEEENFGKWIRWLIIPNTGGKSAYCPECKSKHEHNFEIKDLNHKIKTNKLF